MRCSQQTNRATRPQQNEAGARGNKNATIAWRAKGSGGGQRGVTGGETVMTIDNNYNQKSSTC